MIPELNFDSQALGDGFKWGLLLVTVAAGSGLVLRLGFKIWNNLIGR